MIDQQVRHIVTERRFGPALDEALKRCRVHAVLQAPGRDGRQDRLTRNADMQRSQVLLVVEAGRHPALGNRVIPAVRHVLFARPQQLHRCARRFLGDEDGLADIVDRSRAAAESAAQERLVELALRDRQAARF